MSYIERHIMVDIETAGTKITAPILTISAIMFNPPAGDGMPGRIGANFTTGVQLSDQVYNYGMAIEPATFFWWLDAPSEARFDVISKAKAPLKKALLMFKEFIAEQKPQFYWANSPGFDLTILRNHMNLAHVRCPWRYYEEMDVRTLGNLLPEIKPEITPHTSMGDCYQQIHSVMKFYEAINKE